MVAEHSTILFSRNRLYHYQRTRPLTPSTPGSDPTITYANDWSLQLSALKADYYHIENPTAGVWTMRVMPVNVPATGKPYVTISFLGSPIALQVSTDQYSYNLNAPIFITAFLSNNGLPLTGASVVANVRSPSGTGHDVTLYDDGTHGDAQANNGIYSNFYANTGTGGSYFIKVSASGLVGGVHFVREDFAGVVVE